MTDEKKNREEGEASEQELEKVSGGVTGPSTQGETKVVKQLDPAAPQMADQTITGQLIDPIKIDFPGTGDDEDD